jgi:hypothetical protein
VKKRINLQGRLTPDSDDLQPHVMAFADLRARLQEDGTLNKFAALSEDAARRTAVELNYLMRSTKDTPSPSKVDAELNDEVRGLSGKLASAIERMSGVAAGALTGIEDPVSPYEALPRGPAPRALSNRDSKDFDIAFGPELETLRKIDERETSQAGDTTARDQIELLDRYDRAMDERYTMAATLSPELPWSERTDPLGAISRAHYDGWKGPPARQVLLEPLIARLRALSSLAEKASRSFSSDQVGRGKRLSLARAAWEVEYAKICWRCIQDQFGDDVASGLSASAEGDFVQFIRLMAWYASGKRVESGFGGAAKKALAWGRKMSSVEKRAREFNTPNVA